MQVTVLERDLNNRNAELVKANACVTEMQLEKTKLMKSVSNENIRAGQAEQATANLQSELHEVRKTASQEKLAYSAEIQRLNRQIETYENAAITAEAAHQKAFELQRNDYGRTIDVLQSAITALKIAQTHQSDRVRTGSVPPEQGRAP